MSRYPIKTNDEILLMRESGKVAARILSELLREAKEGVTTKSLNDLAEKRIVEEGVVASFKGFDGYPFSIITCIDDEVVHAMPSDRVLQKGELLTIDFGIYKNGFHSDMAKTVEIGSNVQENFLSVGKDALSKGIASCKIGGFIGDISSSIQQTVEFSGCNVVRAFVGHGVGRDLHEDPQIPGVGWPRMGVPLKEGMVLAVEVMYTQGEWDVEIAEDGWTAVTVDGSLSGMFEHTVAITKDGPQILTLE